MYNAIIKYAVILNIIHNIFNLCDTNIVICIILVVFMRADGLDHFMNSRQYERKDIVIHESETTVNFEPQYNY